MHLLVLLFIFFALTLPFLVPFIIMIVSLRLKKPKSTRVWASILVIELAAAVFFPLYIYLYIFLADHKNFRIPVISYITLLVTITISILLFCLLQLWEPFMKNANRIAMQALGACTTIALAFGIGSFVYEKSFAVVENNIDILEYTPFGDNEEYRFGGTLVKSLDSAPKLSFQYEDKLPALDGLTQYFPLNSAFIRATYPMDKYDPYNFSYDAHVDLLKCGDLSVSRYNILQENPSIVLMRRADIADVSDTPLELVTIGKDALVFIVKSDNPINNLTQEDIRGIYSGKIKNWQALGGTRSKISPYQPPGDPNDSFLRLMGNMTVLEPQTRIYDPFFTTKASYYENHKNAIGYTSLFYLNMQNNPGIKALSIDGVAPSLGMLGLIKKHMLAMADPSDKFGIGPTGVKAFTRIFSVPGMCSIYRKHT
jgi:phosphate transport system substrate-binding protein